MHVYNCAWLCSMVRMHPYTHMHPSNFSSIIYSYAYYAHIYIYIFAYNRIYMHIHVYSIVHHTSYILTGQRLSKVTSCAGSFPGKAGDPSCSPCHVATTALTSRYNIDQRNDTQMLHARHAPWHICQHNWVMEYSDRQRCQRSIWWIPP